MDPDPENCLYVFFVVLWIRIRSDLCNFAGSGFASTGCSSRSKTEAILFDVKICIIFANSKVLKVGQLVVIDYISTIEKLKSAICRYMKNLSVTNMT